MIGHAFQVLVEDHELQASLAAIRAALTNNGRFAFETRNPTASMWESWSEEKPMEVADSGGAETRPTRSQIPAGTSRRYELQQTGEV
jgi:hypothetical protein